MISMSPVSSETRTSWLAEVPPNQHTTRELTPTSSTKLPVQFVYFRCIRKINQRNALGYRYNTTILHVMYNQNSYSTDTGSELKLFGDTSLNSRLNIQYTSLTTVTLKYITQFAFKTTALLPPTATHITPGNPDEHGPSTESGLTYTLACC